MSISDAQYQRWLERSAKAPRCALFEITFAGSDGGSVTALEEHQAFVSNMPYVTRGDDTPAHQEFDYCVLEEPSFTRRMGEQLEGRSTQSYGELILSNECTLGDEGQLLEAGVRDDWLSMNWDGRRIRMWIGDAGWPFADFRLVLDGTVVDIYDPGGYKIGFRIGDKGALLDRPIMTTLLGGDGPEAGDVMPLILGNHILNIRPRQTDHVNRFYKISGVDYGGIVERLREDGFEPTVREDGRRLQGDIAATGANVGLNLINAPLHGLFENSRVIFYDTGTGLPSPLIGGTFASNPYWVLASSLSVGSFQVSTTPGGAAVVLTSNPGAFGITYRDFNMDYPNGGFTVVGNPSGMITCDFWGLRVGGGASVMYTPPDLIQEVLTSSMTNTPLTIADIDTANFAAMKTLFGASTQVAYYLTERTTFAEFFDKLMLSVGGWWGFTRDGLLQLGRLDAPAAGTPEYSFANDDVARRSMKLTRRVLPRAEVKIMAEENWQPQTQFVGDVSDYDQEFYRKRNVTFTGVATITSWEDDPASHISAVRQPAQQTYITAGGGGQTEADRLATLFQNINYVYGCDTQQAVYLLQIGSLVYVEHPKFTGWAIVVATTEKIRGRTQIEFFCQKTAVNPETDIPEAGVP